MVDELKCPICGENAKPLDKTGDAEGFECVNHGTFRVAGSVGTPAYRDAPRQKWEEALKRARERQPDEWAPTIITEDFQADTPSSAPAPSTAQQPATLPWQTIDQYPAGHMEEQRRRTFAAQSEFGVGPTLPLQTSTVQGSASPTNLQRNRVTIVLTVDALLLFIDEWLERAREERSNEDTAQFEDLKRDLEELRKLGLQPGEVDEKIVDQAANTFLERVRAWWEKDYEGICEKTFNAAIFVSCVGLCSLCGCGGTTAVVVSGAIAGGKTVVEALKALPKQLPR